MKPLKRIPFLVTVLSGCIVVQDPVSRAPNPPVSVGQETPQATESRATIGYGESVSGSLVPGKTFSFLFEARAGARIQWALVAPVDVHPRLMGGPNFSVPMPIGSTDATLTSAGVYALQIQGTSGDFRLSLLCASGECRSECGPEQRCAEGAYCAMVQCVTTPCVSYCSVNPSQSVTILEPVEDVQAEPQVCGTRGAGECPTGTFCQFSEAAQCGSLDHGGRCVQRPTACTMQYQPVCGCDGRTYGNACGAAGAGVSVARSGECAAVAPVAPTSPVVTVRPACVAGGCSGQLCVEQGSGMVSTCEYREAYACYRTARCERQTSGQCGWTETPQLRTCLTNAH